jgi:hypothetical protein
MTQIYATYIRADNKILDYLGIQKSDHTTMIINFYNLHVLIALTTEQNHLMSSLNNSFFNELSLFKKKLYFVFQYNTCELVPMYIVYSCHNKKTGITTKKKIMKSFNQIGVNIKEVKQNKGEKNEITKFIFDY